MVRILALDPLLSLGHSEGDLSLPSLQLRGSQWLTMVLKEPYVVTMFEWLVTRTCYNTVRFRYYSRFTGGPTKSCLTWRGSGRVGTGFQV